jgi:RNA polymerase sigma-70 factor (ECF subfamily)
MRYPLALIACAALFSAAGAQNLIKNAGFEDKEAFREWSVVPHQSDMVSILLDRSSVKTGESSLHFAKEEQRFYPLAMLKQDLGDPGTHQKIKLEMWVKAEAARKLTMAVTFLGSDGKPVGREWGAYVGEAKPGDKPADHNWTAYGSVLAIPPGTSSIRISLEMYGPGKVWIDDVSAQFVSADTPLQRAVRDK